MLMQLFRPLDMLGWVYRSIRQGLIDMEAMWNLLDTPAEVIERAGRDAAPGRSGQVRFEGVRFGYEPGRDILKGLDLDIPAGTSSPSSARPAPASRPSRGCSIASTIRPRAGS